MSEKTEPTEEQLLERVKFRRLVRNYGNACYHDSMDEADEYEEEILEVYDRLSAAPLTGGPHGS